MFAAHAIASFGDWFDAIAIQVMVAYRWGADPLMIALIPVVMALPGLLLGSFAGTLADRVRQARVMMIFDLVGAVLTVAILFAPAMEWLLPLLAVRAAAGVFQMPAQQALTRAVVPSKQLLQATSLNGLMNQISKVAGPLLGAVLLAIFSPQICIAIHAVARLLSCLLLWPLREIRSPRKITDVDGEGRMGGFIRQWKEGWAFIVKTRNLLHTVVFAVFGLVAILMIDYQFPTLLRDIAPGNESLIGWFVSAIGAGAVGAIAVLNRLDFVSPGWGLGGGYVLIGGAITALGCMPPGSSTFVLLGIGMIIGAGNGLYMITINYILQRETPENYVGRVFGIQSTLAGLVMIGAPLAGGWLIRAEGTGATFGWIGLVIGTLGLAGILLQSRLWRKVHSNPIFTAENKSLQQTQ